MLSGPPPSADERRLLKLFKGLAPSDRETLLAFAAFLAQRPGSGAGEPAPREPLPLPRPATETVVGAIKRLSRTYEMLDRGPLLNETSGLMSAHVLQGRPAAEVIDELEALFARHYQAYRTKQDLEGKPIQP